MNKKELEKINLIGKEYRERTILLIIGCFLIWLGVIFTKYLCSIQGVHNVPGGIGLSVLVLVWLFYWIVTLVVIIIPFTDDGLNLKGGIK